MKKPKGITELSSKTVNIKVTIDNSTSKEFSNISVQSENLESGYVVQGLSEADTAVTVVVKGSKDVVEGEHEVEVKATGNDLKLSYSSKTKRVKVRITKG